MRYNAVFRTGLLLAFIFALGPFGLLERPFAQQNGARQNLNGDNPEPETLHVQGNVYMIAGVGANVTVQIGEQGVFLVDSGPARISDYVIAETRRLSKRRIRWIVSTTVDPDHTGGNANVAKVGTGIRADQVSFNFNAGEEAQTAGIIAHENLLNRMSAPTGTASPLPSPFWPTDTLSSAKKRMFYNGEAIEILYQPNAHTDGDVMVYFHKSDVISTGDVFALDRYPMIDLAKGGSVQGMLDGLNHIIDIAIPEFNNMGGTRIVPGHGSLCNIADVVEYRDMATIVRDRLRDMIQKGMTLAQVKAAGVTKDYDGVYGAPAGTWTTDMFLEAAYTDLARTAKAAATPAKAARPGKS